MPWVLSIKFQVKSEFKYSTFLIKLNPQDCTLAFAKRKALYGILISATHPLSVIFALLAQTALQLKSSLPLDILASN